MTRSDKVLRKNFDDGILAGVCSGLSSYFEVDVTLLRALFVASTAVGGFGPALYLALWILLDDVSTLSPEDGLVSPDDISQDDISELDLPEHGVTEDDLSPDQDLRRGSEAPTTSWPHSHPVRPVDETAGPTR